MTGVELDRSFEIASPGLPVPGPQVPNRKPAGRSRAPLRARVGQRPESTEEEAMAVVLTALGIETGVAIVVAASLAVWARRGFPTRRGASSAPAE